MEKKVVIIGGGFGGLYALKSVYKNLSKEINSKKIEVVLIDEKNYFLFTPLLHEVVTSSIERDHVMHPLREICKSCKSNFIKGKVKEINLSSQLIKLNDGFTLSYDYLVISIGAKPNFCNIKGADVYAIPLKSLDDAERIRNKLIHNLESAEKIENEKEKYEKLRILIVGAGPTGIELATEIQDLLEDISNLYPKINIKKIEIFLFEATDKILRFLGEFISKKCEVYLNKINVKIFYEAKVEEIGRNYIKLSDERKFKGGLILWNGGVLPENIKFIPEIEKINCHILTTSCLNLKSHNNIFAIGDTSCILDKENSITPVPQTAQAAVKMGQFVGKNLKNLIDKKPLKEFVYQNKGYILPLGKGKAFAEIFGIGFSGFIAWFIYRATYLSKMPGFSNKIKIGLDWLIDFFFKKETAEYK